MKISKYVSILLLILVVFLESNCKKNPVTPSTQVDSTSHHFVVTRIDTLGGWFSDANGVDCLDANNIWVVGSFTTLDAGNGWSMSYNLAHWNGQSWERLGIKLKNYSTVPPFLVPLGGIKVFDSTKIFITPWGGEGVGWYDGKNWSTSAVTTANVSPNIWTRSPTSIYMVWMPSPLGAATYYDGKDYIPLSTGKPDLPLNDVWGDAQSVYTLGSTNMLDVNAIFYGSVSGGLVVANSYAFPNKNPDPPNLYMGRLMSIYRANAESKLWVLGGEDNGWLYEITSLNPFAAKVFFVIPETFYSAYIRGNADNDLFIVGMRGDIWHYNGSSWKYIYTTSNFVLSRCCVKGDTIVLVGTTEEIARVGKVIVLQRQ